MMPIWKLCQFANVVAYLFVQALHMPRSNNSSGVYRPKYKKKAHFSLVSLSVYSRSRRGAERIRQGEGCWSRPPKTALEGSYLTESSSSENRILRPRREKLLTESPAKRIIIYSEEYISIHFSYFHIYLICFLTGRAHAAATR